MKKKEFAVNDFWTEKQENENKQIMNKIRKIVQTGKHAEIKQDTDGKLKVYQVSKEIA